MTKYANLIERLEAIRDRFKDRLTDGEQLAFNQALDIIDSIYDPADDDIFRKAYNVHEPD